MPKVTVIAVTVEERAALKKASRYGATPSYRLRCQAVLLKSHKRSSLDVANLLGCCEMSGNDWLGRGRKATLPKADLKPKHHVKI